MSQADPHKTPNADKPDAPCSQNLPRWLKRRVPKGNANHFTARLIEELELETVCEHARCPNRMECYADRTATFLILGNVCTRNCAFCGVPHGRPVPPDLDEPRRIAEAASRLGLRHVVITCVTRDDLPDGGADQFRQCVESVREKTDATIEVLPSDLGGNSDALDLILDAKPDVFNHNVETVPRLYREVRGPKPRYEWTLAMFRRARERQPQVKTKSGLMLGLGETDEEIVQVMRDLHASGCQMLTIGQYLRPSSEQAEVQRYVPPEEFERWKDLALEIGFESVASGPLVRSSYHAREMLGTEEA